MKDIRDMDAQFQITVLMKTIDKLRIKCNLLDSDIGKLIISSQIESIEEYNKYMGSLKNE